MPGISPCTAHPYSTPINPTRLRSSLQNQSTWVSKSSAPFCIIPLSSIQQYWSHLDPSPPSRPKPQIPLAPELCRLPSGRNHTLHSYQHVPPRPRRRLRPLRTKGLQPLRRPIFPQRLLSATKPALQPPPYHSMDSSTLCPKS